MGTTTGIRPVSRTSTELSFTLDSGERIRERIKVSYYDPKGLQFCKAKRHQILLEIGQGTFEFAKHFPKSTQAKKFAKHKGDVTTVNDAIGKWLVSLRADYDAGDIKHSTHMDYNSCAKICCEQFGDRMMTDIKLKEISSWLYARKNSLKRANNLIIPLRRIYSHAFEQDHIETDILNGWTPKIKSKKTRKIDPFTPAEVTTILDNCEGQLQNFFRFAFWTGLRSSELISLRWDNIDFDKGVANVTTAFVRTVEDDTKTEAGLRAVKLFPEALKALKDQKQFTLLFKDHVFHNPHSNRPWRSPAKIRLSWIKILEQAEVRYRVPYQTRHTYASMMLTSNEDPLWVSNQMGHADKTMVYKAYATCIEEMNPDAGMKAVAAFEAALKKV